MNKRLKELEKQSVFYHEDEEYWDFDRQKFAELIIRECAHLVGGYTKENEFGTDVKEAYEEITKHFGVEE